MAFWTFRERRWFITVILFALVLNAFGFDLFGVLDFSIAGLLTVRTLLAWAGVWILAMYWMHKLA